MFTSANLEAVLATVTVMFLLTGAYLLPTNNIVKNVEKSAYEMKDEGMYPRI